MTGVRYRAAADVAGRMRLSAAVAELRGVAPGTAAIVERWAALWRPSDATGGDWSEVYDPAALVPGTGSELERLRDEISRRVAETTGHEPRCTCRPCMALFVAEFRARRGRR